MASRRFGVYFAWSRPLEIGAELGILENRFPTLFEIRRALWPMFERLRDPSQFPQGVEGFMDHVILADFQRFRQVIKELTGHEVPIIQRQGDKPPTGQLDDDLFKNFDTLIVVSLDHLRTSQAATSDEIQLIRRFLSREEHCVVICPHHDVGVVETQSAQELEFRHHGDITMPPQQRFSGFARSVLTGLGFPIENQFGLNPACAPDGSPAPLVVYPDLDDLNILHGVTTFTRHPHLPHLHVPPQIADKVDVLARQPINLAAGQHPFVDAGNRYFNALLRLRSNAMGGSLFVCDATVWTSAFGGLESLRTFWGNLAKLKR